MRPQVHHDARRAQDGIRSQEFGVGVRDRVKHEGHLPLEDARAQARRGEPAGVAGDVAEDVEGVAGRGGGRGRAVAAAAAAASFLLAARGGGGGHLFLFPFLPFLFLVPPPLREHLVPDHPHVPPLELRRIVVGPYGEGQGASHVVVGEGVAAREREERRGRRARGRFRGRRRRSCSVAAPSAAGALLLVSSRKQRHGEFSRVERRRPEELRWRGLR